MENGENIRVEVGAMVSRDYTASQDTAGNVVTAFFDDVSFSIIRAIVDGAESWIVAF